MTQFFNGSVHCGQVAFKVTLEDRIEDLHGCLCSLCHRKGVLFPSKTAA